MLPYFKRSEDNERGEDHFHGAGGPLTVSESRSMHPLVDAMIEAARQAGHEHNPDFNGARQEGVGRFQLTQRDGRRLSTSDAFLHPVRERPNLTVITHAYATAAAVRRPARAAASSTPGSTRRSRSRPRARSSSPPAPTTRRRS